MNTFGIAALGIGFFAIAVGLVVALAEWWDHHHASRSHKHA